ncbi:MAG: aminodeoxychorismate synthase component I [Anaeromyxobacter sp.]
MRAGEALLDLDGFGGRLAFGAPRRIVEAWSPAEVRPALEAVEAAARGGAWAVGFVAYEAASAFDPALRTHPPAAGVPLVWFGVHDEARGARPRASGEAQLGPLLPDVAEPTYRAAVERLREAMAAGVAYQVNHTFRLRGPFSGDPLALYERLRAAQGGGLSACLSLGDRALVSASPELFLATRGRRVVARPMKGTARRGRFLEEDQAAAARLAGSEKERAENVMIVDLLRNDLGRVAVPGTVEVTALCQVERYRTVLQLTSTVEAELRPDAGLWSLLSAAFPCGSVTGAPKASAMGLIAAAEPTPRGVYCGAVGVVAPGGDATFNVAIRTVWLDLARGEAVAGVGGGITFASSAEAEWQEALAKGAFLSAPPPPDFALLETLRLEDGRYPRLDGHLARLIASARHLERAVDAARVRAALEAEAAAAGPGAWRVRLTVGADGRPVVERAPAPAPPEGPAPVALARQPVSSRDPFLFHKTTWREPYERARREAPPGLFDVLLWNEAGQLTEFTIGNVVLDLEGERVTPPREAGLLGGVFRAELLARGEVRERPLPIEVLGRARAVWLVNALRGWVPVRLEAARQGTGV